MNSDCFHPRDRDAGCLEGILLTSQRAGNACSLPCCVRGRRTGPSVEGTCPAPSFNQCPRGCDVRAVGLAGSKARGGTVLPFPSSPEMPGLRFKSSSLQLKPQSRSRGRSGNPQAEAGTGAVATVRIPDSLFLPEAGAGGRGWVFGCSEDSVGNPTPNGIGDAHDALLLVLSCTRLGCAGSFHVPPKQRALGLSGSWGYRVRVRRA